MPLPGSLDGLTQWEVTLAETLSDVGYATGAFGKWHLGSSQDRLPNAQGFDEWFGIPRTTDEAMFPSQPGAKAAGVPFMHIMEGRKGEQSRELSVYDLEQRPRVVPEEMGTVFEQDRVGLVPLGNGNRSHEGTVDRGAI